MSVPAREPDGRNRQQSIRRRLVSPAHGAKIRRRPELVDVQQRRKPRFETLKFRNVLAGQKASCIIVSVKPVIQSADDMRHPTAIGIDAARSERRYQLPDPDLFSAH